jgi:hypothetical protein
MKWLGNEEINDSEGEKHYMPGMVGEAESFSTGEGWPEIVERNLCVILK